MSSKAQLIKGQLASELGSSGLSYWRTLADFLGGKIVRAEFEDLVRKQINTPRLAILHNSLLLALLESSSLATPRTPPPDVPKPQRKRKRMLPYQGDDDDPGSLRSVRLKKWVVGMGKRERERMKELEGVRGAKPEIRPIKARDEIARERGVRLLSEGKDAPGTHLPLHLAQTTRAPTTQHIAERLALISAQNNLSAPSKQVSSLMLLAYEAKIKHLVTHALTLTSSSRAISSINPSSSYSNTQTLSASSFEHLFTIAPHALPNGSAAAMKLALGENEPESTSPSSAKERHHDDPRWQLLAILKDRSGIREVFGA